MASYRQSLLVNILMAAGVFAVDLFVPLGVAAGVPYVLVMLSSLAFHRSRAVFILAALCSILTVAGFFLSPPPPEGVLWMVLFNRGMALLAIWVTAFLCALQMRARDALTKYSGKLEELVEKRTEELSKSNVLLEQEVAYRERADERLRSGLEAITLGQELTRVANESDTTQSALQTALDCICVHTGWPVGHAFVVAEDGSGELAPAGVWHLQDPERFSSFKRITEETRFAPGIGLPGRVFSTGKPTWISDVTKDLNFPRAKEALELNVRAGFAFPVLVADDIVAVLEFFSADVLEPDEALLNTLGQAGVQLGRVFERQRAAEASGRALVEAERANTAKSVFLANMSHELRTPLNAVLGFSQVLARDAKLNPQQLETVGTINRSGEHLLRLINDVLEMSRIEAGRTVLNFEEIRLSHFLSDIEDMIRLRAVEKGLVLAVQRGENIPDILRTDAGKLRQILTNLMGNATKFTDTGHITLRVFTAEDEELGKRLVFQVEDTGRGIPEDRIDELFEPFSRLHDDEAAQGGSGLGLAISREFVELMGGTLRVRSELGHGSLFEFDTPLVVGHVAEIAAEEPERWVAGLAPGQASRRILIVEDEEANARLILKIMEPLGLECRTAVNGKEGVAIFEEWAPHLVWMDIRMPIMDGYEATQRIKATAKGKATPVIAITASVLDTDRGAILAAGCDDFVQKPYREERIYSVLSKYLGLEYVYEEPRAKPQRDALIPLESARLEAVPGHLLGALGSALEDIDLEHVNEILERIGKHDTVSASLIEDQLRHFNYETVLSAIRERVHDA